jgi:hypothetical protein
MEFAHALARERQILIGRLLALLNKTVKNQKLALTETEQHPRDAVAPEIASHFPKAVTHGSAQGHSHRPPILNAHKVLSNDFAISFIKAAQPIPHHLVPSSRPVKDNRDLARRLYAHSDLFWPYK